MRCDNRRGYSVPSGNLASPVADAWFGFASRWKLDFTQQRRCPGCIVRDPDGKPVMETVVKNGRELVVPRVRIKVLVANAIRKMKGQKRRLRGSNSYAVSVGGAAALMLRRARRQRSPAKFMPASVRDPERVRRR